MSKPKLPTGWSKSRIGDVVDGRIEQGLPEDKREFTYIDISAVDNRLKEIIGPKSLPTAKAPSRARQQLKGGDVLVSTTRPNLNAVALVPPRLDGAIASTGFAVLRPVLLEPRWLYSVVQSEDFVAKMSALVKGALYPAIRPSHVHDYVMPVPPLAEQKRITRKLNRLKKRTQNVSETLEALPDLIQQYRAAVLEAACSGHLVPTEAELARQERRDFEPASALLERILVERRAKWEADQLDKMRAAGKGPKDDKWKQNYREPEQPKLSPPHWMAHGSVWVSLDQLLYGIEAGKSFKCLPRPASTKEWGVIKVSAMSWGQFDESENKALPPGKSFDPNDEIREGDILLSRSNTSELVGASVLVGKSRAKLLLSDKSMRLLPSSLIHRAWLQLAISSRGVRSQLSGVATGASGSMLNVSQEKVLQACFPLPPLAEQMRIVVEVEHRLLGLSQVEEQAKIALELTRQLRASIFHQALSGDLLAQSTRNEPAERLLQRIATAIEGRAAEHKKLKTHRRMKKSKPREVVPLADQLLSVIEKQFGRKPFTFQQLVPHLSHDYETVKIEIFHLLAAKKGRRLKQVFNAADAQIELCKVGL